MATADDYTPLDALIEQASDLARDLRKAGKIAPDVLRERADVLVRELDAAYPKLSAIQQVLGLARELAHMDIDQEQLRKRAEDVFRQKEATPTKVRRHAVPASTRPADAWILDMFRATESAIPREVLVEEFVKRYSNERRIGDSQRSSGPWLFVFEAESESGVLVGVSPSVGLGLHPQAFQERCRMHLPHWRHDPFLEYVLKEGYDIDGWYASAFGGSPLFDALLDVRRQMKGESDYWLNAVCLPGDGRHESRAVFTLYPNAGDVYYPEPPAGLRQDMRLLTVLGLAWRALEHQVRALARISETDRRDMISLIAPGLLHHEIGFNMRTAYGQAYEQFRLLKRIANETGREDIELAARYSHGIAGLTLKLYRITDAFNNLDKRAQVEDSDLQRVFEDLMLLLHHRLGAAHTEFQWDEAAFRAQALHTDVVLLSQALLNIVNNALNALVEGNTPPTRHIRAYIEKSDATRLTFAMVNNGPSIPVSESRDIFKRGYTTRRQGHGQGLYLARLVAHYLGGNLQLMDGPSIPANFNVGFRMTMTRHLSAEEGVSREND